MSEPIPARGVLPSGYKEVLYWTVSQSTWRAIIANLVGFLVAFIFNCICLGIAIPLVNRSELSGTSGGGLKLIAVGLMTLLGIILIAPLHLLLQGAVMKALGARPQIGFEWKGLIFYITSRDHAFKRGEYLIVLLTPLVGLTLIAGIGAVLLADSLYVIPLVVFAAFNLGVSSISVWILAIVLRYPASACVVDEKDGMRIFVPERAAVRLRARSQPGLDSAGPPRSL